MHVRDFSAQTGTQQTTRHRILSFFAFCAVRSGAVREMALYFSAAAPQSTRPTTPLPRLLPRSPVPPWGVRDDGAQTLQKEPQAVVNGKSGKKEREFLLHRVVRTSEGALTIMKRRSFHGNS